MNQLDIKAKLKLLIAYDIGEVFDVILQSLRQQSDKINDVILLLSRYQDLNRDAEAGRLDRGETTVEMNRLRLAILDFIDEAGARELNFEQAGQLLLTDRRFERIIAKRTEKITFRGMLGHEEEITIETLEFKWDDYLMDANRLNHWIAAIQLLRNKHHLPVLEWKERNEAEQWAALYRSAGALRMLPTVQAHLWEHQLEIVSRPGSNELRDLPAYVHETIEVLSSE